MCWLCNKDSKPGLAYIQGPFYAITNATVPLWHTNMLNERYPARVHYHGIYSFRSITNPDITPARQCYLDTCGFQRRTTAARDELEEKIKSFLGTMLKFYTADDKDDNGPTMAHQLGNFYYAGSQRGKKWEHLIKANQFVLCPHI
jgi:hypothetical protein